MSNCRHIAVLTGKRGGFGAMKPMLEAMRDDPMITLSIIVTDQHLNPKFGATLSEIKRDFKNIFSVPMHQKDGTRVSRARALGVCVEGIAAVLEDISPDMLVLYGDRGEVMAAALSATTLNIPIAHLQGGDLSGNTDEVMRHAVTKLSHLHFPSTNKSGARIRLMGEESWRVHVVGDNHVDAIVAGKFTDESIVRKSFSIPVDESPIIVLLHPETTHVRDGYKDMRVILESVAVESRRTFVIYPCSDSGYEEIIAAIEEFSSHPGFSVHKNIDAEDFWGIQNIASLMIGNSSAGLIETPYFALPAVNVGLRQEGREHGYNVIHSDYSVSAIRTAIEKGLRDIEFLRSLAIGDRPFGDGTAWRKILGVLKEVELGSNLLDKRFVDRRV